MSDLSNISNAVLVVNLVGSLNDSFTQLQQVQPKPTTNVVLTCNSLLNVSIRYQQRKLRNISARSLRASVVQPQPQTTIQRTTLQSRKQKHKSQSNQLLYRDPSFCYREISEMSLFFWGARLDASQVPRLRSTEPRCSSFVPDLRKKGWCLAGMLIVGANPVGFWVTISAKPSRCAVWST